MAQAMNETKSTDTDKLIAYFEKEIAVRHPEGAQGLFPRRGIISWSRKPIRSRSSPRARPRTNGTSSTLGARHSGAERAAGSHQPDQRAKSLLVVSSLRVRTAGAGHGSAAPWPPDLAAVPSLGSRMQFGFLLEQVVNGLVLGGYYLLIALGLSLIFSVGGVVNLAHGAFYALGAYVVGRDHEISRLRPGRRCCRRSRSPCSAFCSNATSCAVSTPPIRS